MRMRTLRRLQVKQKIERKLYIFFLMAIFYLSHSGKLYIFFLMTLFYCHIVVCDNLLATSSVVAAISHEAMQ